MEILKNEYKITKDKDFIGQRFSTYTIEKIITYKNGEVEHRFRCIAPAIEGNIDSIDLDKIEFKKPIIEEEWKQLSNEYRKAWINGTMTAELSKELDNLRAKVGVK